MKYLNIIFKNNVPLNFVIKLSLKQSCYIAKKSVEKKMYVKIIRNMPDITYRFVKFTSILSDNSTQFFI